MQTLPELSVMENAVRGAVCPQCLFRPPGSEKLGPTEPRSCQPTCTVFQNLPTLRTVVAKIHMQTLRPYERAVRELVCQTCRACPTAGDYCADRTTGDCPLSLYLGTVVDALERVSEARAE